MAKFGLMAAALAVGMMVSGGPALAAGDAAKGKKVFKKCSACHSVKPGKKRIGPSLFGIVGRKAGKAKGFRFSSALKKSKLTWDEATLDKFIANPKKVVKGTRMSVRIKSAKQRSDLIAYLKTIK
jgi:cytochrome c